MFEIQPRGRSILHTSKAAIAAPTVALREVRKVHGQGDASVVALDGITIGLSRGSFTAIMGPSGSGKSTFLHIAAGLDREPTGALDTQTGRSVLALLRELVDSDGHTVVMVTHDPQAAAHADRVILLADGRLVGMLEAPSADEVAEHLARLGS